MKKVKRALALSGGGPVVGVEIGALQALIENNIDFDVWTCDCIGSWVGCVYNSMDNNLAQEEKKKRLEDFFSFLFVEDDIYELFPVATAVFVVDYFNFIKKIFETNTNVFTNLKKTKDIFNPLWIKDFLPYLNPFNWPKTEAELFILMGEMLATNPFLRLIFNSFWKMEKSGIGISHVNKMPQFWEEYLNFEKLNQLQKENKYVYINTYNLTDNEIELFSNNSKYQPLCIEALQAGSSVLFYVENPEINGKKYCEGANKDTLNFKDLLVNHPDLEEIWVIRLTDYQYVNPPKTLIEAASLQIMLPFSTIAEDDIKLFKYHLQNEEKLKEIGLTKAQAEKIKIIEIKVQKNHFTDKISYEWNKSNYQTCKKAGYQAAMETIKQMRK